MSSVEWPDMMEVKVQTQNNNQLTKREQFALAAVQGFWSDPHRLSAPYYAKKAVELADALIAELEKPVR